ncbi:MAG: PIN domain-containing protein, partial [Pseudonocardia sp.]|nr:PIN domain-containing protein [Pseudonocardia sp.]
MLDAEALFTTRSPHRYEAYEFLPADQGIWDRVLEVQRGLARRSMICAVGVADLVIAAVAERHRVTVLHYDADFEHVAAITGQPVEWVV